MALASLGYQEESTETTQQSSSDVSTSGLATTLSQTSKTLTARLYQGGTSYNMLSSRLTWQYNGSSVTYATWWASAGWTSPWRYYGSSDNSLVHTQRVPSCTRVPNSIHGRSWAMTTSTSYRTRSEAMEAAHTQFLARHMAWIPACLDGHTVIR